jgi:hypothetical protein
MMSIPRNEVARPAFLVSLDFSERRPDAGRPAALVEAMLIIVMRPQARARLARTHSCCGMRGLLATHIRSDIANGGLRGIA